MATGYSAPSAVDSAPEPDATASGSLITSSNAKGARSPLDAPAPVAKAGRAPHQDAFSAEIPTAEGVMAQSNLNAARGSQLETAKGELPLVKAQGDQATAGLQSAADLQRAHSEAFEKMHGDFQDELQKETNNHQQLREQLSNFKFHDLWSSASEGDRSLGTMLNMLNGFTGGNGNPVKEMADADHAKQADNLSLLKDQLTQSGLDQKEIAEKMSRAETFMTELHAQQMQQLTMETAAAASRIGTPEALQKAKQAIADFQASIAQDQNNIADKHAIHATVNVVKKLGGIHPEIRTAPNGSQAVRGLNGRLYPITPPPAVQPTTPAPTGYRDAGDDLLGANGG